MSAACEDVPPTKLPKPSEGCTVMLAVTVFHREVHQSCIRPHCYTVENTGLVIVVYTKVSSCPFSPAGQLFELLG